MKDENQLTEFEIKEVLLALKHLLEDKGFAVSRYQLLYVIDEKLQQIKKRQ